MFCGIVSVRRVGQGTRRSRIMPFESIFGVMAINQLARRGNCSVTMGTTGVLGGGGVSFT